ncbi:alpha/beta hydrolase [Mesorhizobium sp.]|uniref:alpha/beta hydrolase n=1 Tax=Mesorhizobium sp. TaxID=1871066 RepID=UPI000FE36EB0|nr:alpha/beta hydrolase [Mesorhizobium sp.]RWH72883.1 MAG: alpha/beta hydrolase [Mesorhizobium sp.]RWL34231.1 MAG: alpha/beta hydrolase [Mesorhizobium sp.]RWL35647.1 MAG: alpha/beta hydrolase [Mesorhizobium sp.]RWL41057.1 MAG: alpha/beta hydrolase [Mesorhizobium sp.]RWL52177.1 MAG: alpha/beta hydrolase [Mesorhizobium sp.]
MDTLHLVDPAARDLALAFAAFDPTRQTLDEYRAALDAAIGGASPASSPKFEEHWAEGLEGQPDVRLLAYRPAETTEPVPAILFIHASGFIAGRPEWMATANQALADEFGAMVVAVNYRLAPEASFPGPLYDCYAALRWLHDQADRLGIDPGRILVMGESAGGGLAASLALLARDRREVRLAGQVLVYPMLDPRTGTSDAPLDNPHAGEFVWTRRHNRFGWEAMRGGQNVTEENGAYFAAGLSDDLAGLPPAFIAVGALDLFVDEDADYALRLARSGVPVEFHLYPGGIHGFDMTDSSIAEQYRADRRSALSRMLAL